MEIDELKCKYFNVGKICVSVTDSGVGMSEINLTELFQEGMYIVVYSSVYIVYLVFICRWWMASVYSVIFIIYPPHIHLYPYIPLYPYIYLSFCRFADNSPNSKIYGLILMPVSISFAMYALYTYVVVSISITL